MSLPKILFIDAASYAGWAVGEPGEVPQSGSMFFASSGAGASRGAVFSGAMRFTIDMIKEHGTDLIIGVEAPIPTSFFQKDKNTNAGTTEVLYGLTACIVGTAYMLGCYNVDTYRVDGIRKHFIGKNMKGKEAKPIVMQKCRDLGWVQPGDADQSFDRSDALAGWSKVEHVLFPSFAQPIGGLFAKTHGRKARGER